MAAAWSFAPSAAAAACMWCRSSAVRSSRLPASAITPGGHPTAHASSFNAPISRAASSGREEIYTVTLDGRPPQKMLSAFLNEFGSFKTAWHPDSKRISVWGNHLKEGLTFWTVPLDGVRRPGEIGAGAACPRTLQRRPRSALPTRTICRSRSSGLHPATRFTSREFRRGVRNIWKVEVDASTLQWRLGPQSADHRRRCERRHLAQPGRSEAGIRRARRPDSPLVLPHRCGVGACRSTRVSRSPRQRSMRCRPSSRGTARN